jgi:dTDP-4-amino-4,6-dideoxygalactose transaminase
MATHTSAVPLPRPSTTNKLLFPFLDLKAQYERIAPDILEAVSKVLTNQGFILGPEVSRFEEEVSRSVGVRSAIGCASGSDALLLALMALNVGPGDEVITTPFTFVATAGSIARLGAKPVFVDIEPDTFNLDPGQLAAVITERTKAIIVVHLFGLAVEMDSILSIGRTYDLPIIEDAAQAIGARYKNRQVGSIGTSGCFSFFPSKNLGGAGDGGMITTDNAELADRLSLLRVHGSRRKYQYEIIGINSRLDALQAAILRAKWKYLDEWTEARRRNASRYRTLFEEAGLANQVTLPSEPAERYHVYNQFCIRVAQRDELRDYLRARGIPTEVYYPLPLHLQPAFSYLGYQRGALSQAEAVSREVLALPIFPELTEEQQALVVKAIADFCHNVR